MLFVVCCVALLGASSDVFDGAEFDGAMGAAFTKEADQVFAEADHVVGR